jgi:L-ascorbate metabolism protein UlaG (beta-lactamase superfamily)
MRIRLVRNATLVVELAGRRLLVDPALDEAGARPPVGNTPHPRRNPLVPLPVPAEELVAGLDAVLVTHLHRDHFDDTAAELVPQEPPLFCQPEDAETLRERGFADVRPVAAEEEWEGIVLTRTPARHGTGEIGAAMAPASGFVLRQPSGPSLYLAGDTILCPEVRDVLASHRPEVVVVNAGGAHFTTGDPIVMTAAEVVEVARLAPWARVVAVHLEAINHCPETRADLHQLLVEEGLVERVTVPEDGAAVPVEAEDR